MFFHNRHLPAPFEVSCTVFVAKTIAAHPAPFCQDRVATILAADKDVLSRREGPEQVFRLTLFCQEDD